MMEYYSNILSRMWEKYPIIRFVFLNTPETMLFTVFIIHQVDILARYKPHKLYKELLVMLNIGKS